MIIDETVGTPLLWTCDDCGKTFSAIIEPPHHKEFKLCKACVHARIKGKIKKCARCGESV